MKKFLKYTLVTFLVFLVLLVSVLGYIFIKPQVVINPEMLNFALEKTKILKEYSWKEAQMNWGYKTWKHRTFEGRFTDLCFNYDSEPAKVDSCIQEISWNIEIIGLSVKTISPIKIHSNKMNVILGKTDEKEPSSPPDIWNYWTMLWSDMTPDMDIWFRNIKLTSVDKKTTELDFKLVKIGKELNAEALKFHLFANPEKIVVTPPKAIPLPKKLPGMETLYFRDFKLTALMKPTDIKVEVVGFFEVAQILVNSQIDLPIKDEFTSVTFLKKVALKTTASVDMPALRKNLARYAPDPYKELPAPFNVMDGKIGIKVKTEDIKDSDLVMVLAGMNVDLKSEKQALNFDMEADVPVNLKTYKPESVSVGLDFHQVQIQLPRLSKKSPPPQLIPDGRFKNRPFKPEPKVTEKPLDITLHLQALNEKAMSFRTNLLDEILKLNFDLNIVQGNLKSGFLSILPLKTSVFKRPIHLKDMKITFNHPVEPVMEGEIQFPLPEYKITLKLEGPVSKPRYAFTSEPPLPQNDIYAVLLFGRPMADLDPDDKSSAQQTNKLLSQGILSLSVLYFLAGSPVEYVGYDPGSKNAVAQFGLGNKTSLRVGGGGDGINSSAIRRSLGKGWYLDTSVQNSSQPANSDSKNYGVLLERIITY